MFESSRVLLGIMATSVQVTLVDCADKAELVIVTGMDFLVSLNFS